MDDRQLLELAAKAAGYSAPTGDDDIWLHESGELHQWNPLTDDGDALRLAVKLSIVIDPYTNYPMGEHFPVLANITDTYTQRTGEGGFSEAHNGDPYAATRRAIVRAAATIGAKEVES